MERTQKPEGFVGQRIVVLPQAVVARALADPLLEGLFPTDIGYYPKASGHWIERAQGPAQAILIYCVKGAGWCDLAGTRHRVAAGDLLVVPPGQPHAYGADSTVPWTIPWVHLAGSHIPRLLRELGVTAEAPVAHLGGDPRLLALYSEALQVLEQGYTPAQLLYASQTLSYLLGVMIWHRTHTWRDEPNTAQRIAQSVAFMKEHLTEPLRVSRLAAVTNFSTAYFSQAFKAQTGYAPIDYLIRLRMHQACQFLDATSLSVKAVAEQVGYADQLYFSRAFRQVNGVSPTEYRARRKG